MTGRRVPEAGCGRRRSPSRAARAAAVLLLAALAAGGAAGCAASGAFRSAQQAELQRDFDRAVLEYRRAVEERPDDRQAQLALNRARLRAAEAHYAEGRRLARLSRWQDALAEFQVAYELNPSRGDIAGELRAARDRGPVGPDRPRRGRDRARCAHRPDARRSAARARSPTRHRAAGHGRVPRRQRARRLLGPRAVRCRDHRLRPDVSRFGPVDRSPQHDLRRGARRGGGKHPELRPRHGTAHRDHHPRHPGQAAGVRGRGGPDLLSEPRRRRRDD